MAWVNLAFGFQCSTCVRAHQCGWWLAQGLAKADWLNVLSMQRDIFHVRAKEKPESAVVPGLYESLGQLHTFIRWRGQNPTS